MRTDEQGLVKLLRRLRPYEGADGSELMVVVRSSGSEAIGTKPFAGYATAVVSVTATTHTVVSANHNKILDFTHASGCTVTVPDGLTSGISGVPFTCGLSKGAGAGDVTVVAGVGGTVNAPGGFLVMNVEFGLMTLTEWPDGTFRLFGATA